MVGDDEQVAKLFLDFRQFIDVVLFNVALASLLDLSLVFLSD